MKHLRLPKLLFSLYLLLGFTGLSIAYSQSYIWDNPEGQACIEEWMTVFTSTLNRHNGNERFNQLKPWSFSPYGHIINSSLINYRAPDDWTSYFEGNKYKFLWAPWNRENLGSNYAIAGETFAGLQLRFYVQTCLANKGIFYGSDWLISGSSSAPGTPSVDVSPTLTAFDANASCPSNFSMHNGSTLSMICYCSPGALTGTVWGTGVYTSDSSMCKAAQHAGAISSAGGMIVVKGASGQTSYQASSNNGINSGRYSSYPWSFFFPDIRPGTAETSTAPSPPSSSITTDWTVDLGELKIIENHIETSPPAEGLTSMYIAPLGWHGDWSEFAFLLFDKKSWGGSYYLSDAGDVVLKNGSLIARYTLPEHHNGEWRSYTVPLYDDGNWVYSGATSLSQILTNVTEFQIRAEYGNGTDHSALANVSRQ